jgi:ABC-2 type transport system permease protein
MSPALAIAAKDLRQKVRDRSAIILSVVAPLALAFLFSTMIPAGSDTFDATYAVVDLDGGPIARALVDGPLANLGPSGITVVTAGSDAEARASVGDGSASAAIVIPTGFSDAIVSGQPARITIVGSVNATLATQVLQSIVSSFGSSVEGVGLAVSTVLATGGESGAGDPAAIAQEAQAMAAPVTIATADTKDRLASSNTYYAASMAVLFVFFAAQFGVVSLLGERRAGTLARLLASPISARTVLIGKLLVSIILGLVSMTIIAVATTLLLGAHWGDPVAVTALIVTTVLAASGIALIVVGFARTEDQAAGLTAIVALVLAVLGGSFFPLSQAPEGLATLSLATPHAWFLRGIGDLASGEGIGAVLPSVAVLGLLGLATCAIGLVRAERAVIPR